jgi:hypothetical protein
MPTNRQPIAKVASKRKPNRLARLNISVLEADVAYFDARLAMLDGSPDSFHQEAQIRVYSELERVLSGMLQRLRRQPNQGSAGVEVREWLEEEAETAGVLAQNSK